jgi:undecaprenyl pyrophosphate phosphatase UppP
MRQLILLFTGIILTILFMVFATDLFEMFYYEMQFSNEMYNNGLYFVASLSTAIIAWLCAAIFYYGINSVSFSRWYHWLVMLVIAGIIVIAINVPYLESVFSDNGIDFSKELAVFAVVNIIIECIIYTIASFSMRWWSTNCRHTPIPE